MVKVTGQVCLQNCLNHKLFATYLSLVTQQKPPFSMVLKMSTVKIVQSGLYKNMFPDYNSNLNQ